MNLIDLTYEGYHDGVTYSCRPARHGKGVVLNLKRDQSDGWKDRAQWLAEALNGRWARGHQPGWRMSPSRAAQWKALFLAGWDAFVPMYKSASHPPTFRLGDGPKLTLKEVLKVIKS